MALSSNDQKQFNVIFGGSDSQQVKAVDTSGLNKNDQKQFNALFNVTPTPAPKATPQKQQPNFLQGIENFGVGALKNIQTFGGKVVNTLQQDFTKQPLQQPAAPKVIQPVKLPNGVKLNFTEPTSSQKSATPVLDNKQIDLQKNSNDKMKQVMLLAKIAGKGATNIVDQIFSVPDKAINYAQQSFYQSQVNKLQGRESVGNTAVNDVGKAAVWVQNTLLDSIGNALEKTKQGSLGNLYAKEFRGIQHGIVSQYLGDSKKVMDTFNTPLDKPVTWQDKVVYTTGDVVGSVLAFIGGGEVLKGVGLGKAAMPILFATLGQTSSPSTTTALQRIEKAPIDAIAGWLFGGIAAPGRLMSKQALETTAKAIGVGGVQTFIDSVIEGMNPKDAAKTAATMGLVAGLFHIGGTVTGLFTNKLLQSSYRQGTIHLTPDELRMQADSTNFKGTKAQKDMNTLANDAETQGKDIEITLTAAKKSKVADVFRMQTPNGIQFDAKLVSGTGRVTASNEYTPSEARSTIINNNLQDTPEGKTIIKASIDAEQSKKNLTVGDVNEQPNMLRSKITVPEKFVSPTEKESFSQLQENPHKVISDYVGKYGNVVSADLAQNLFPSYKGHNVVETQRAAGQVRKLVFDHLLNTEQKKGNNTVLITSGGSGAGKTSSLAQILPVEEKNAYPLILDTSLASHSSDKDIEKMLNKGYKVQIAYVLRDPLEAWKNGVLPRTVGEGRVVSEGYHQEIFARAKNTIIKLHDKFKDNPNVDFRFIDNTGVEGHAKLTNIDFVKNFIYNKEQLGQEIAHATDKFYKEGQLTEEQYKAAIADRQNGLGSKSSGQPEQNVSRKQIQASGKGQLTSHQLESYNIIQDAIHSGDYEAAAALYNELAKETKLPPLEEIQNSVEDAQKKTLDEAITEIKQMQKEGRVKNPDDPTNQLLTIADKIKAHFNAPRAKFKITGKQRIYTVDHTGESIKVGGSTKEVFDRLIYATDIEGFKRAIRVFAAKFDKTFSEIDNSIRAGSIDGADYEQFKKYLSEANITRAKGYHVPQGESIFTGQAGHSKTSPNRSNEESKTSTNINEGTNNASVNKGGGKGAAIGDFAQLPNLTEAGAQAETTEQRTKNIPSLQFPEIVRMVRELTGKYPEVWKKMGNRLADAQEQTLRVRMRADVFKNSLLASEVLSHELGHIADYLPEGMRRKGNLLARISSINGYLKTLLKEFPDSYDNILTPQDREALKKQAKELSQQPVKVEERVAAGFRKVTPGEIISIWNDNTAAIRTPELLAYIQGLSAAQKRDIAIQAMKGKVADWVDFQHTTYKTITKEIFQKAPEDVRKLYRKLLEEEIIRRRLHDLRTIRKELFDLSQKWRPFDPKKSDQNYINYRKSSSELYADAVSVLFNDPVRLKLEAPNFWKAFFNYIDVKPEVSDTFFKTWDMLNKGEDVVMSERRKTVVDAFNTGEEKWAALRAEQQDRKRNYFFEFKYDFIDRNQKLLDLIKQARKQGKIIRDDQNPEYLLNGRNYLAGRIKYMLEAKVNPIYQTLRKNNLTMNQLDELLLYQRIMAAPERQEVANPYGLDKKTAADTLDHLKKEIGEGKFTVLDNAARSLRSVMKEYLKEAHGLGMYSDELYKQMAENPAYATFAVLDYLDTYISAHVYQTTGTLKEVASPSTATIMKMISTIRGLEHQRAKLGTFAFLKENFPDEVVPAKKMFNGKIQVPVESEDANKKLVKYLDKGKVEGYYLDNYIASSLNYETPDRINLALRIIKTLNGAPLRPLFITFNTGFQTFNFVRDFKRYVKNYPSKSLTVSVVKAIDSYARATKPAFARAFDKENAIIQEMEDKKVLSITYNDMLKGMREEDKQVDFLLKKYDVIKGSSGRAAFFRPFLAPLEFIERMGNMIETLPKVAGYQSLQGKLPPGELANFVRSYLGSPDFLKGGKSKWWTNEMFLFSNAITQGMRADYAIASTPKSRGGYWWKTAMMDFLPKLLMFMAAAGLFGAYVKKQMDDVSEYDKTNYIIVPFGEENNKTTYLRIPQDETGRFFGGLLWKGIQTAMGKEKATMQDNIFQLLSYAGGQFPSLTPTLQVASAIGEYMTGQNPYDFYRGRSIIPNQVFKAGGMEANKAFAYWVMQNLGANIVLGTSVTEATGGQKGWLQNLVEKPILSNIIGRWIKVSNYGQTEQNNKIKGFVQQQQSQQALARNQALQGALDKWKTSDHSDSTRISIEKQLIQNTLGTITADNKQSAKNMIKKFKLGLVKGQNDPNTNAVIDAQSIQEKELILQRVKAESTPADWQAFKQKLADNKIISKQAAAQFRKDHL